MAESPQLNFVHNIYRRMFSEYLTYAYQGLFTDQVGSSLIILAENLLKIAQGSRRTKKKVFYVLVECVQNITRHQEKDEEDREDSTGIFVIQNLDICFNMTLGNLVLNEQIASLKSKLDQVNKLSRKELTAYYKTLLQDSIISEKGGAGLGLIEIARKSGNRIEFMFHPFDENHSHFYMSTKIDDPDSTSHTLVSNFNGVKVTHKLHDLMREKKINLLFRSEFSRQSSVEIVTLVDNLEHESTGLSKARKKIFSILVELLQNISKHGASLDEVSDERTGLLIMGRDGNTHRIITGNPIRKEEVRALALHIDFLNKLNEKQLENLYSKVLLEADLNDAVKNGLGLIDIRLKSGQYLDYYFDPLDEHHMFFTIQSTISL